MTLSVATIQPGDMDGEQYRWSTAAMVQPWQPSAAMGSWSAFWPGAAPDVSVSGMATTVGSFRGQVQGTAAQAAYQVRNVGDVSVTHDAGGAQDRVDSVVCRILNDDYDSSGDDSAAIVIVKGTEATVPVPPDLNRTDLLLADIAVPAGASAASPLTSAAIDTSRRPGWVVAAGGILPVTQNDPVSGAFTGQWRDDAGSLARWDGDEWTQPLTRYGFAGTSANTVITSATTTESQCGAFSGGWRNGFTFRATDILCDVPGNFIVSATLKCPSNANGTIRLVGVKLNGDLLASGYANANGLTSGWGARVSAIGIATVAAGDVLTFFGRQDSGSSMTASIDAAAWRA